MSGTPAPTAFGPWNPGLRSQVPRGLLPLVTLFRAENAFTRSTDAYELHDLTGIGPADLAVFRPSRLALHEVLVRVTADFSVPDGTRIEDLGINFRRITRTLLARAVEPRMDEVDAAYTALRMRVAGHVERELAGLLDAPKPRAPAHGWFARWRRKADAEPAVSPTGDGGELRQRIEALKTRADADTDAARRSACRALARVLSALLVRHGDAWGGRPLIASLACGLACNDVGSEAIGALIEPWLREAAAAEGLALLPPQRAPVVMNTKGASASGKSTLRPLQKALAGTLGLDWSEFALISPDIWRKQLLDYGSLGDAFKYGGAFTGDEVRIIDQKLDRYMAQKARRGSMPHLLIDRFRFDSFAPDSSEAGSNLLTRFGHTVYLYFMITPPASLVERAWARGLEVGRYKAVDDTLAHCVDAYAGIPQLFFTWVRRADKPLHFEFLDNSVAQGQRPRTVAFGDNATLHVLDVGGLIDVDRFRHVNVDASGPETLFPDPAMLAAERNTAFVDACVREFATVEFADPASGRVYLRLVHGKPVAVDATGLDAALRDPDSHAALARWVPQAKTCPPVDDASAVLSRASTLGAWQRATPAASER
jgi:hypothetical protein